MIVSTSARFPVPPLLKSECSWTAGSEMHRGPLRIESLSWSWFARSFDAESDFVARSVVAMFVVSACAGG